MSTKFKILIFSAVASALCCASCTKDKLEAIYSKQETRIESFITSQTAKEGVSVVYNGGADRIILVQGDGDELSSSGTVTFHYAGYTFNGSVSSSNLFATNSEEVAKEASWGDSGTDGQFEAVTLNLKDDKMVTGLRKGLVGVKAGEECYIVFSGKYGFGKHKFGTIDANSALLYHIWVSSISNE